MSIVLLWRIAAKYFLTHDAENLAKHLFRHENGPTVK